MSSLGDTFNKVATEVIEDTYDEGVRLGLDMALKLCEVCHLNGAPMELAIEAITRLRDNPPPRSSP